LQLIVIISPALPERSENWLPSFDVIHFDHLDASIYLPEIPKNAITVIDEHNIVSNQIATSAAVEGNPLRKFYLRLQHSKTKRYEAQTCANVTQCFVCSDMDRQSLARTW